MVFRFESPTVAVDFYEYPVRVPFSSIASGSHLKFEEQDQHRVRQRRRQSEE